MRETEYNETEKRVVDFLNERGLGGGDDPVGFLLASYAYAMDQRTRLIRALEAARSDLRTTIANLDRATRRI